jgi:hypothetical protein
MFLACTVPASGFWFDISLAFSSLGSSRWVIPTTVAPLPYFKTIFSY